MLLLGLGIAIGAIAAYAVQIMSHRLTAPWYLPYATTLGVAFVALSLWQMRTVWRVLGLILVLLLAGGAWMLVFGGRLPPYTGPVAVGRPFPAFETIRADGTPFTDRDLQGNQNTILVFFRGRW
jgi:hypothetical protein